MYLNRKELSEMSTVWLKLRLAAVEYSTFAKEAAEGVVIKEILAQRAACTLVQPWQPRRK